MLILFIIMGQYFKIVFLSEHGDIRIFIQPGSYNSGVKLLEHCYIENPLVKAVEFLLSPEGMMYKSRIVWAGDYAEPESDEEPDEEGCEPNLYWLAERDVNMFKNYTGATPDVEYCQYIVNHTKRSYVDKGSCSEIHPLPMLTMEGEYPDEDIYGIWARDVISMERSVPEGYEKLTCEFKFD
jgi:hypothetical protein